MLLSLFGRRAATAPSLYERHPHANAYPRSAPRTEVLPAEAIGGTTRHPSNTGADLLPVPGLRTTHWKDDWRRILRAQEELVTLPPVEILKVGETYYVIDGHKRVAAARQIHGLVDAIVVELCPAHPNAADDAPMASCGHLAT